MNRISVQLCSYKSNVVGVENRWYGKLLSNIFIHLFMVLLFVLSSCKDDGNPTPVACPEVPEVLKEAYQRDVAGMAINYLYDTDDPLFYEIEVPSSVTDEIWQGMAAIYESTLPERDSVFSHYCVHHVSIQPTSYSCIVQVTEGSAIAEAWESGELLTGIPAVDELLEEYSFTLVQFNNLTAVIRTDRLLNMPAFALAIKDSHESITHVQPNLLTAGAGRINYHSENGDRYYDFVFEWFDCYDLCDNYHKWKFKVDSKCQVTYLGMEEGGVNGPQPLPEPLNCGL